MSTELNVATCIFAKQMKDVIAMNRAKRFGI